MTFTKLDHSIITSTLWCEELHVRVLWITMLAMTDSEGRVTATIPGLARLANISMDQCVEGIEKFMSPDQFSRTKTNDGRRIEEIDGGWKLLNFKKYRGETSTERTRKWREKNRDVTVTSRDVTGRHDRHTDTDTDKKKNKDQRASSPRFFYPEDYEELWRNYPAESKGSKREGLKEWKRLKPRPDTSMILRAFEEHSRSAGRKLKCGEFVASLPHFCRYLKRAMWEDCEIDDRNPDMVKMDATKAELQKLMKKTKESLK